MLCLKSLVELGNDPTVRLGETNELQGGGDDIRCPLQDHAIV
jgi:hypothetical protein